MKLKIPALHHHQASGRGRVSWEGRHIYFGKWDDPATHEAYRRWAAELITGEVHTPKPGIGMTVSELAVRYIEHCSGYYPPHSTMHGLVKNALDAVVALYGSLPLDEFGPKALRTVRGTWLKREHGKPLSRCSINKFVSIVKRMFRWATSQEFVDVTVYQALATLDNLKKGRSGARETKAIEPVSQRHIEAVLKIAPRIIRDMITVQMLCGARPGELCALKRGDIDTGGAVWIATLSEHKTAHIEGARARLIPFGPKCQAVLKPYMLRPMDAHIFDPRESVAERPAPKGQRRRPGQPENIRKTGRTIRDHYDKDSYRRAVNRLCERAGIPVWSPNQLRKVAASRARERFGLDGAQVLLGHSSADVTQIYAKLDEARLIEIAKELG